MLNCSFIIEGEINGINQVVAINSSSLIKDLADAITYRISNLSLQNYYTVYASLISDGGESVTTKLTHFSKFMMYILNIHNSAAN